MPKTRLDVIQQAHRQIGVLSADEEATADQESFAGEVLDTLFAEVTAVHSLTITWTLSAVPDSAFLPLARLLATEIASHYEVATEPRSRALMRYLAVVNPDNRTDSRDYDDDGTVSDEEADAAERALYY